MIRKLKFKMFICLFLLVTVFSVTSSCFAFSKVYFSNIDSSPYTLEEINQFLVNNGLSSWLNRKKLIYEASDYIMIHAYDNENISYLRESSSSSNYLQCVNSSGSVIKSNILYFGVYENGNIGQNSVSNNNNIYFTTYSNNYIYYSNYDIYDNTGKLLYNADSLKSVDVIHEFQSDTSAKVTFDYSSYGNDCVLKYSLSGIDLNSDLNESIQLRNPVTYIPGVSNLVVKPNTKVYWVLYDLSGKVLESNVYQVPEYNVQIENADKSIEYSVSYNEDYTSAIISASLINKEFSDSLVYSEFSSLNISTGKLEYGYKVFNSSLNVTKNGKFYLYAVDNLGNVFDTAVISITDIFNFTDNDFSYELENNSTLHGGYKLNITPTVKNWSSKVDIMYEIELTSGQNLSTVTIQTEYPELSYVDNFMGTYENTINAPHYFRGRVMSGDTIHIFSPSTQLEDLKGNITFKIYKKADNSIVFNKTYNFSANHFSEENQIGGSAGDISGSLPNDSNNSNDFTNNDYGDVTWTDVEDYVGINGSFWSVVKTILNTLPKWITAPLFFFISAIVAIALIKAILPF